MIITIIIVYILGCFACFLMIGWMNDIRTSTDFEFNIWVCLTSWAIPILKLMFIISDWLKGLENYKPSLKAFLQLFQKREE